MSGGGDLRVTAQEVPCTPAGGARPASEPVLARKDADLAPRRGARSRTRLSGGRSPVALHDHRLPSGNPAGWPRPVISAESVLRAGTAHAGVWIWQLRAALTCLCLPLLLAVALAGCVSKSKANAQAHAAFMAGQQQAMMKMQQAQTEGQGPCVTVNGEVRNHVVPWTQGLTLAKAVVAADYCGTADPGQILIVHNGIANRVDPKQLLSGVDIPLQPGDIVQLVPPGAAQKP